MYPHLEANERITNCKSCGARILWKVTARKRRQPFDVDGGPHHATCPNAKQWHAKNRIQTRERTEAAQEKANLSLFNYEGNWPSITFEKEHQ